jgi:ABC-2 type transport system permease protein
MSQRQIMYINSFITLASSEVNRIFRIWTQTLLPPVITQSLYFLIFGNFVGSRIQGSFAGTSYIAFIIPGLVMMGVIMNSFQNVVASFYGAKFQKSIQELLVSPTPNWIILAGYVFGGIFRGLLVGAIIFAVSAFFVRPEIAHIQYVILFALLTSILFASLGFFNSLFAKSFDDVSIIPTFVLTPLTYLGGVFYSIEQLPPIWQVISRFNPIVYMIDGFRYGFYNTNEFPIIISAGILIVLNIILLSVNWYLLKKGYGLKA